MSPSLFLSPEAKFSSPVLRWEKEGMERKEGSQQAFIEHLLCARCYFRCWGYSRGQDSYGEA
jgi:hypothetical protein